MELNEIKISELTNFLQSDLYKNSKNIPITQQRALSQIKNPRADKNDTALIIAVNNKNIVGFIGALPEYFPDINNVKLAWNSCWWVDAKTGKQSAIPLFLKFLKSYDNQVMFRDLTDKTEQIINRLNLFEKVKKLNGVRYFLRFNTSEILMRKSDFFKKIKPVLQLQDNLLNLGLLSKQKILLRLENNVYTKIKIDLMDDEAEQFIQKNNKKELFKRSKKELNWILNNPWIVKKSFKKSNQFYYFSDASNSFKNDVFKVYNKDNRLIAVLFFTLRNGLVKLPYAYFNVDDLHIVTQVITDYLQGKKAISFLTFNPQINKKLQQKKHLFWYKKPEIKDFVVSKKIIQYLPENFVFQDGEGDFVFT